MDDVAKHPRLLKRGSVYYFRAKVPKDVVVALPYGLERVFSLRTSDHRLALSKVRVESVKFDQEVETARKQLNAHPRASLSDLEIERLCALFRHEWLAEDERSRMDDGGEADLIESIRRQIQGHGHAVWTPNQVAWTAGMSDRAYYKKGESIETLLETLQPALARHNTKAVEDEVAMLLEEAAIKLDRNSPSYQKLALAVLKTYVRTLQELAQRQKGVPVDTPPAPAVGGSLASSSGNQDNPPLSVIFDMYLAEKSTLSPKTVADFKPQIRRFIEFQGDLPIRDITRKHVREFKDALTRFPARLDLSLVKLTMPDILERTKVDLPRFRGAA